MADLKRLPVMIIFFEKRKEKRPLLGGKERAILLAKREFMMVARLKVEVCSWVMVGIFWK